MSYKIGNRFVSGVDRLKAERARVAHLYDYKNEMNPLCRYGWNRGEYGFSILRGWKGRDGYCKLCLKKEQEILAKEEEDGKAVGKN